MIIFSNATTYYASFHTALKKSLRNASNSKNFRFAGHIYKKETRECKLMQL